MMPSDVAGGANDVDLERDELSCERRQPAVIALGSAILDPDILAVDKASILEAAPKRRRVELVQFG
ncbi:MAG: hypothetical protein JWP51_163 [Bradyrhizobium sp.]|nr:hypothetical protein [Bradyrhizobium sp.]